MIRFLVLLFCLLLASPAYAVINIYVDTDATGAEDGTSWTDAYTSLADAEAENLDLVTAEEACIIWCRASSGSADTSAVVAMGWTTSETYDLTITVPESDRHAGAWDNSIYRLESTTYGIDVYVAYLSIDGLQIAVNNDVTQPCIRIAGDIANVILHTSINACLLWAPYAASNGVNCETNCDTVGITNTICWKSATSSDGAEGFYISASSGSMSIHSSTVYGFNDGLERDGGTMSVNNSVVFGSTDDFDGTMTITNCASDDGDGTNAATLDSTDDYANEFADVSTYDFSLVPGSGCIDAGTGTGAPSTDIIGTSRPQGDDYDIGAFEYTSGAAPATPLNIQLLFF